MHAEVRIQPAFFWAFELTCRLALWAAKVGMLSPRAAMRISVRAGDWAVQHGAQAREPGGRWRWLKAAERG